MKRVVASVLLLLICLSLGSCAKENPTEERPPRKTDDASGLNWIIEPKEIFADVRAMERYYDTTTPLCQYLTFMRDGKWGVLNDRLEVTIPAVSDTPAQICSRGEIHIIADYEDVVLENGLRVTAKGHGDGQVFLLYNTNDALVYVFIADENSSIVPVSGYPETLPAINCVEFVDLFYDEAFGDYDYESTGQYSYCDADGNLLTEERYDGAQPFRGGVAAVSRDGKWGYIDESFAPVTPFQYDPCFGSKQVLPDEAHPEGVIDLAYAYSMCDGYAPVLRDGKYGVISQDGTEVLPCNYDKIVPLTGGRILVLYARKWGIADIK